MHKEINFEDGVEHDLIAQGGFVKGDAAGYDPQTALFPQEMIAFVRASQPVFWARLEKMNGATAGDVLVESLVKELKSKGMLTVLRDGFKCFGKTVQAAYFAPNTGMNPAAQARFEQNRLTLIRQVQTASGAIPDVVLAVNGLPVVSMELKNPMSGQTVDNAIHQYKFERDPKELLFAFQQRCLVHFAVDPDQVYMTTQLARGETYFLPFNRGHNHGAGNPPVYGDVRTSYLWQEVLCRESLMDILGRFLHLQVTEKTISTERGLVHTRKEALIFPRYHQLDVVRRLADHARQQGAGHNYLVQHSAGSGKSNSIAWLAHRLSSLHNAQDEKIFHSVVVITDRLVLDQQLQETIYQFEHKQGVVQKIDENTQQLAKALADGVPVIISTVQKFPFIAQALNTLEKKGEGVSIDTAGKRYAVIVDEAHSSQSGETAMELRKILNREGIEAAIAEQLLELEEAGQEDGLSEEARANLMREQLKRTRQPNLSYFAFTATPKYKTKVVFDEPGPDGRYSMRQAIEEGFILDVLAHYIHYKRYYELLEKTKEDPEVPRRRALTALTRFVDMHAYNIDQKVEVIVEHFRNHTRHKIGGRAKAMVVTSSREHAVRYKLHFDRYLQEKGYTDIKSLVAFSGEVHLKDHPGQTFTEVKMNGGSIQEKALPAASNTDAYQVLLVAEKYQTGFDQPLLHTMYVDKRLSGVHAVQTLSRLNRTTPGKEETFVLDFVNEPEDIYLAFKPYYETTPIGEESDPQQLNDLAHRLQGWQLFYPAEVDAWCEIWFRNRMNPTGGEHRKLNSILDRAVDRFKALEEEAQEQFKGQLVSFRNLYLFLSQMIPYQDSDLEKLYTYGRFLLTKLPRNQGRGVQVDDDVQLKYYRLQMISEGSIDLSTGEPPILDGPTEVGTGGQDEEVLLSTLVLQLNERFGTDFTPADQYFFDQVRATAVENESLRQAAQVNSLENFTPVFEQMLQNLFVERMEGNEEIFMRLMNEKALWAAVTGHLLPRVYGAIRGEGGGVK